MSPTKTKVSIIIPSFNSWKTIPFTLERLLAQTRRDCISEVVVVDSSDDGKTRELLKRYQNSGVELVDGGRRLMPALGRNLGASRSKSDLLAFIDSDAYMAEDWLDKVLSAYERGCRVGGGAIVLPDFQKHKMIAWAQYFLQFNEYMDTGAQRTKDFLPSCNMFCERSLFEDCGGFPEIRASEDVLFFLKAGRKEKVWFLPEAKVYHIFREALPPFLKNQELLGKFNIIYRRREMKDRFFYKGVWPLLFFPAFMGIKIVRIVKRVLTSRPSLAYQFLRAAPMFALGLAFWGIGFVKGIFTPDEHP